MNIPDHFSFVFGWKMCLVKTHTFLYSYPQNHGILLIGAGLLRNKAFITTLFSIQIFKSTAQD